MDLELRIEGSANGLSVLRKKKTREVTLTSSLWQS